MHSLLLLYKCSSSMFTSCFSWFFSVHFYSSQYAGFAPPQTVNVTGSVKFPGHCERAGTVSSKGQDWSFYFLSASHKAAAPTAAAFQHRPGRDSLKHWGRQMALIWSQSHQSKGSRLWWATESMFPLTVGLQSLKKSYTELFEVSFVRLTNWQLWELIQFVFLFKFVKEIYFPSDDSTNTPG